MLRTRPKPAAGDRQSGVRVAAATETRRVVERRRTFFAHVVRQKGFHDLTSCLWPWLPPRQERLVHPDSDSSPSVFPAGILVRTRAGHFLARKARQLSRKPRRQQERPCATYPGGRVVFSGTASQSQAFGEMAEPLKQGDNA